MIQISSAQTELSGIPSECDRNHMCAQGWASGCREPRGQGLMVGTEAGGAGQRKNLQEEGVLLS